MNGLKNKEDILKYCPGQIYFQDGVKPSRDAVKKQIQIRPVKFVIYIYIYSPLKR